MLPRRPTNRTRPAFSHSVRGPLCSVRTGSVAALLLLAVAPSRAQDGDASQASPDPTPPRVRAVIARDSVSVPTTEGWWDYRLLRVAESDEAWVDIEDPYGGRILLPRLFADYIADQARALAEGSDTRVVASMSRPQFATVVALVFLGGASLPLAMILLVRRRLTRERKRRQVLQETARQLAESREDERLRIARDLHDGPLQDLQALHMQLSLTADAVGGRYGPADTEARRLRGALDEAHTVIGELRGIAEELRPPALGPFGLAAALEAHAERYRRRYPGIAVDLDLDRDGQTLPVTLRTALFRIAQEAMNNAATHGQPHRVLVRLDVQARTVSLCVEDDGAGLTPPSDGAASTSRGRFGVLGMRERAEGMGGYLELSDRPGGGTRVTVRAPLPVA